MAGTYRGEDENSCKNTDIQPSKQEMRQQVCDDTGISVPNHPFLHRSEKKDVLSQELLHQPIKTG
ncbi:hypothetical protein [Paenibacillus sp. CECT 9249]|uniref:hypothetical protein n=1 Tax=Paenibacillus sp. CECT 9249 TaxID=2845385 RepID=UPI001E45CA2D|nr:hypothetical protein [Paenibacillus sp. CECT 9249]